MPLLYHYTDVDGAKNIIRVGKILASLKTMANVDGAYGNGVYLTNLDPETSSKQQIALNNWTNTSESTMKKLKNYFVLDIPASEITDTNATGRKVFLFGHRNDVRLYNYSWWLKDIDTGDILASYKYQVVSLGPASVTHSSKMGVYTMTDDTVNGRPVYQNACSSRNYMAHLFMDSHGSWGVGPHLGNDNFWLVQVGDNSLGPDQNSKWEYVDLDHADPAHLWRTNDATLKASAFQM